MIMKKQLRWSLAIITLLSLAGCGLKGPLYFPPAETPSPAKKVDTAQPADAKQPIVGAQQ
ncbi:conserved exported hypothetical protein [Xenorhabdus nematophila F1]|nr:conserved exported hypothetical protein [Xenorhabdus nematophila F1]CEE90155.1 hypothetical protein; putative exported protein [Xenorhabdus nematophila str. Anatoliense]CEE95263.1 hypothetical protein; putative exported protein [Xenorhabdus nematophila str. Anatoliense]CEF31619.1 hypothetical protein; putative exported protein [Xenorhabdus nematophila str. Websteri]CEK21400.1 hypothetical protein; putative exported protein [Xenorhabdus nematophila AN6/1]